MNILILAAGPVQTDGINDYPLCLSEFNGIPLIQHITKRCIELSPSKIIYAFQREDIKRFHLDDIASLLFPGATILEIPGQTQGAACTALLASRYIENEEELLILNCNEVLETSFLEVVQDFRNRRNDAGVVFFNSVHPRYSYIRLDEDKFVLEAAEKRPISNNATAGFYWFKFGCYFIESVKKSIRKDASVNGIFYICPTLNELILVGRKIGAFSVNSGSYYPLKSERQIERMDSGFLGGRFYEEVKTR